MKFIIAEKPSVATEIAKVLGVKKKKNSYYQNNEYIISWCYGHLVELATPELYNERLKKWELETLPIIPEKYKLAIKNDTKNHFYMLKQIMNNEKIKEVICATDSGREGELIFRLVYQSANCKKPVKRLWISSLTEESIEKGFRHLKPSEEFDNLYKSAWSRMVADWLVGINGTRFYSQACSTKLTVGRVQTPTLALIVERENNIQNFIKEKRFKLLLQKDDFIAESRVFENEDDVKIIFEKLKGKEIVLANSKKENKKKATPKLYDLTELQKDCNKYLGLTAQETLNIAQKLYEKKLTTYPRTDCKHISTDMEQEVRIIANKIYKAFNTLKNITPIIDTKKIINDTKITDHHAIIPTERIDGSIISRLNKEEQNVYLLICKRLLEAINQNLELIAYTYILKVENEEFKAKDEQITNKGYKNIEDLFLAKIDPKNNKESKKAISTIGNIESIIPTLELKIHEYETQPLKRYTDATLLSTMENIDKKDYDSLLEDENINIERKGLGTPATRSSIIEKLISVGYVERKNKTLSPTSKGINCIKLISNDIKSPKLTAEWEIKLQKIEKGKLNSSDFLKEITEFVKGLINIDNINNEIKKEIYNHTENKEVIGTCPKCGDNIYENSKTFYCNNKECKFVFFKENKFFSEKKIKLTKTKVKQLLKDGKTKFDKIYSSKKDTYYSAEVGYKINGDYVNYELFFK